MPVKSKNPSGPTRRLLGEHAGRYVIHALLFLALYVLFAGLLAISGIVEQISMDTGSGSGQNNSGLLLLYLMPLTWLNMKQV